MRSSIITRSRLLLVAAGTVTAILASAGGAYAYWTTQGTGSASATSGTMQTVTVAAFANEPISNKLYPGGPAGDLILDVTNPNLFTTTLFSVAANGGITADGGHPGCVTTGVTFTPPAAPNRSIAAATKPGSTVIPTTTSIQLTGVVTMDTTSDSGCQGATFHIPVTITVHR